MFGDRFWEQKQGCFQCQSKYDSLGSVENFQILHMGSLVNKNGDTLMEPLF